MEEPYQESGKYGSNAGFSAGSYQTSHKERPCKITVLSIFK